MSRARVAQVQGVFYAATGLWALFDLGTFEWATGPKIDHWLVKTVALLLVAIGTSLLIAARRAPGPESVFLGMASAGALLLIDVVYVRRGTIGTVYLLDACIEAALLIAWTIPSRRRARGGVVKRAAPF